MGHCAELAFALWATVQNLLKSYGPQRRIWLSPVGPLHRILLSAMGSSAESQQIHWKVCHNPYRNSKAKSLHLFNALPKAYSIHAWNPSQPRKKNYSALWATVQNDILIQIPRQNWSWIQNGFRYWIRGADRFDSWKKPDVENLVRLSL
jgi:hypothetical protein